MNRNEGLPLFWHTLPTTKSILELNLNFILHSINPKRIKKPLDIEHVKKH